MKRWWQERTSLSHVASLAARLLQELGVVKTIETRNGAIASNACSHELHIQKTLKAVTKSAFVMTPWISRGDNYLVKLFRKPSASHVCSVACASIQASLNVQRREYATCTPAAAKAAESTSSALQPSTKVEAVSEPEFQEIFFNQPITQRLAAMTVAEFQLDALKKQQQSQKAPPTKTEVMMYMPMFDFVRRVPALVRDDIFRRQQDAVQWVTASPLLQLVDHRGNAISPNEAFSLTESTETCDHGNVGPLYNPLLHVRVSVAPEWVRSLAKTELLTNKKVGTAVGTVSSSDASSAQRSGDGSADGGDSGASAVASRGMQGEAVRGATREILLRVLRSLSGRTQCKAAAAAVAAGQTLKASVDDTAHADAYAKNAVAATAGRYVPLVDVLLRVRKEASESDTVTMSPATREVLVHLPVETLEEVVNGCGLPVTVGRDGRRRSESCAAGEYPAPSEKFLWVVRPEKLPGQRSVATFVALRYADDDAPPRFHFVHPRITTATAANNYGGWGSASAVPTKEDVYEILKYIPVNWGNMGNLNIPAEVRRRHIRCASPLQWYRRQPYYFELRNLCGTLDIRRSIVLHPEAHGLTKEEARELLELQLATGTSNNLAYLDGDGAPSDDGDSPLEKAAVRFLLRVCPTYFAPLHLTAQRYTKKNLSEAAMLTIVRRRPQDFEELTTRFSDVVLVRRRGGADSSRWRAAFVADLEKYPEDVRGIMMLCNRMCPSWDRPEFIYVRLSVSEQEAIGGYSGMVRILQRHPTIFRVGKHFVCRADPSDPLTLQEVEPAHDDVTARSLQREENPYNSAIDVALVFHYVAPDNEPCTAAYLADCASPAIRCVLPTRIVTVVQQFPKLFACTETSPGVFTIRKLKQRVHKPTARISGVTMNSNTNGVIGGDAKVAEGGVPTAAAGVTVAKAVSDDATANCNDEDLIQMLEEEIAAEEEHLSKEEVVKAVRTLVPDAGVEASQLLLWASMNVQRAANEYFGGVLKLVEAFPQYFRVVTTEDTKMIYKV